MLFLKMLQHNSTENKWILKANSYCIPSFISFHFNFTCSWMLFVCVSNRWDRKWFRWESSNDTKQLDFWTCTWSSPKTLLSQWFLWLYCSMKLQKRNAYWYGITLTDKKSPISYQHISHDSNDSIQRNYNSSCEKKWVNTFQ